MAYGWWHIDYFFGDETLKEEPLKLKVFKGIEDLLFEDKDQ